jgi:hypothetical protein
MIGHNLPPGGADPRRDYVLVWLRCLHARMAMFINELDCIGVSLRDGFVTPDDALDCLDKLDPIFLELVEANR